MYLILGYFGHGIATTPEIGIAVVGGCGVVVVGA